MIFPTEDAKNSCIKHMKEYNIKKIRIKEKSVQDSHSIVVLEFELLEDVKQ